MQTLNKEASAILPVILLFIIKDVPPAGGLTEYQCIYYDTTLTCYTSDATYACCLEKYSTVRYKCGEYCFGEVFYQQPSGGELSLNSVNTMKPYRRRGFLNTDLILAVTLPIGLAAVIVILFKWRCGIPQGITGICCPIGSRERSSNHDVENALNESRQEAEANGQPPTYDEAECNETLEMLSTREQSPTDTANRSNTERIEQPPTYEDINGTTLSHQPDLQQPPSYSCINLPVDSADQESNLPPSYTAALTPT